MKIAIFRCCITPVFLKQYETTTNAVLESLGIDFIDIKEFNCCGYPLKNINFKAHVLSTVRNLALAEKNNVDIMTFCNCCYGTIKNVNLLVKEDPALKQEMNDIIGKEGLSYKGTVTVKHFMDVLYDDLGIEYIQKKIQRPFKGLKVASHYGCHILRPSKLLQDETHNTLSIFDQLVKMTGAESVPWRNQRDCCGAPVWGTRDNLSEDLTEKKVMSARKSGADFICSACTYCQLQFDRVQKIYSESQHAHHQMPSILFSQLIGLSLGIDKDILGIDKNELDISRITNFLP